MTSPKFELSPLALGRPLGRDPVAVIGRMRMSNSDVVIVEDDDLMGSIGKN